MTRHVDTTIPGDVIDYVGTAERLVRAMNAVRVEVIEGTGIQDLDLRSIDARDHIPDAEVYAADP